MTPSTKPKPRGFAAMTPKQHREIASKGGRAVPAEKRSFSQDAELRLTAASKGGSNVSPELRTFSANRKLAKEAGRKGGKARSKKKREESHGKPI